MLKDHPEAIALAILILLLGVGPLSDDPTRAPRFTLRTLELPAGPLERIEVPLLLPRVGHWLPRLPCPRLR